MKHKYELMTMHLFEYKALENYFQEMSEKGWFVDRMRNSYIRFYKAEPKKLYYHIGFNSQTTIFEVPYLEGKNTNYTEFMESFGYTYVSSIGIAQIFVSENENPLFSEPEIDEAAFRKATFKDELGKTLMPFMLFIFLGLLQMTYFSSSSLANNQTLLVYFIILLGCIYSFIQTIPYLKYCLHHQLKEQKINFYLRAYQWIVPVVFLLTLVLFLFPPKASKMLLILLCMIMALRFFMFQFVNRGKKHKKLGIVFLLVMFWFGYVALFMNDVNENVLYSSERIQEGTPFMSAQDFQKQVKDSYIVDHDSFLMSMQEYGDAYVSYHYYVMKDTPLKAYCLNKIIHEENFQVDDYIKVGDVKLYQGNQSGRYHLQATILVKGNQVLVVDEYREVYLTYFQNHV